MSEFFDELITGLNEAVAIERGELKGLNKNIEAVQDSPVVEFFDDKSTPLIEELNV